MSPSKRFPCTFSFLFFPATVFLLLLPVRSSCGDELADLIAGAEARNPRLSAARDRVTQALAARNGLLGFFDPAVSATGDKASGDLGYDLRLSAEIETPFKPGFYLTLGAAENRLVDPGKEYNALYQTVFSAGVTVPLLRDRGFRKWRLLFAEAEATYRAAGSRLLWVRQDLRHRIEQRYIAMQEARSAYDVAQGATARVEKLLGEAKELVRLKVVPEYQLFPARMEVALARASELQAAEAFHRSVVFLAREIGAVERRDFRAAPEMLIAWARGAEVPADWPAEEAFRRRGDCLELAARRASVQYRLQWAREELKSDLSLSAEAVWTGEDPHDPLGTGAYMADRREGGIVSLTWRRPLGRRTERAEVARQMSRLRELDHLLEDLKIGIRADLTTARSDFESARRQLVLVTEAVRDARQNLAAEAERFRLGEGRSRNVLDAQKDLTNAIQRQTRTAAALLRAQADFFYAVGYKGRPVATTSGPPKK
ncbi:MAG: TolC family protein [Kiritimatiellaeota bacterium]|nr:TolC family protein [Kiritimatiellota bacterium]